MRHTAVCLALVVVLVPWTVVYGQAKDAPKVENPPTKQKKPPEKEVEVIEWTVKPDPLSDKLKYAELNPDGAIKVSTPGPVIYSQSPAAVALACMVPKSRDTLQFIDLRQLKEFGKPIKGNFIMGTASTGISPDGAYFAAVFWTPSTNLPKQTVEVWSTATGETLHKLEIAEENEPFVYGIHFPSKDRMLTAQFYRVKKFGVVTYKMWDLKTGKELVRFDSELVMKADCSAISPGGNYLVLHHGFLGGDWLEFFDLTTGKLAGHFELQDKKEPRGSTISLAFSPDGEKLALLWKSGKKPAWGKLLCWDLRTQKKIHDIPLAVDPPNIDTLGLEGGIRNLQWIPDGAGWMLFGHLLVDAKSETIVWRFSLGDKKVGSVTHRRFLDRNTLSAITPAPQHQLVLESVPWDKIDPEIKKAREKRK